MPPGRRPGARAFALAASLLALGCTGAGSAVRPSGTTAPALHPALDLPELQRGSACLAVAIQAPWTCAQVLVLPASPYAQWLAERFAAEGHLPAFDERFSGRVLSMEALDAGFRLEGLPSGSFLVLAALRAERWVEGEELAQRASPLLLRELASGESLVVRGADGATYTRDAEGRWSPPGRMETQVRPVLRRVELEDAAPLELVLSP